MCPVKQLNLAEKTHLSIMHNSAKARHIYTNGIERGRYLQFNTANTSSTHSVIVSLANVRVVPVYTSILQLLFVSYNSDGFSSSVTTLSDRENT